MAPRFAALALTSLALLFGSGHALGDSDTVAELLRRAQREERVVGALDRAVELYREAARAGTDPVQRAQADVRAASCLRRLDRPNEARALLEAWRGGGVDLPASLVSRIRREWQALEAGKETAETTTEGADDPRVATERLVDLERQRDELQATLDDLVLQAELGDAENRELSDELARQRERLTAQQRLIDELRAAQDDPDSPEAVLHRRRSEKRERSRTWTSWARQLHQEGRFEDARAFLNEALRLDRDNADARVLLRRVSAPLGDRERLHQEILEVVALSHAVARARREAQVRALVEDGESLREEGRIEEATGPLLRARALLDGMDTEGPAWTALAAQVDTLLEEAERRGVTLRSLPVEREPDLDPGWRQALRELLAAAGREVHAGLDLGLHDLDRVIARTSEGLPPRVVRTRAAGWTLSADTPSAAKLVAAFLEGAEAAALELPGASIETAGASVVVVAEEAAQKRIADRLLALELQPGERRDVRVHARSGAPGEWAAWLSRAGLPSRDVGAGVRVARVPAERIERLQTELAARTEEVRGDAVFRPQPLRAFRLLGGRVAAPITVDVLPLGAGDAGVGLHVRTEWTPGERADGARIGQSVWAGAPLGPGDGLLVHGLADPEQPRRDLSVLVVFGEARVGGETATEDGGPSLPDPLPGATPTAEPRGSREHSLPSALARYHELGSASLQVADDPVPTRERSMVARLRTAAPDATDLRLQGDRVQVIGPEAAHAAVRAELLRWSADVTPLGFEVVAHAVDDELQRKLLEAVPRLSPVAGGAFAWSVLESAERRSVVNRLLLAHDERRTVLRREVAAPPTGRADAARWERSSYRRSLDTTGGDAPSWGRSETAWIETGLLVALRPFGRTGDGRADLDVSLRATFVSDRGRRERETPLGTTAVERPTLSTVGGDLSVAIPEGGELLVTGLRNPYDGEDQPRSLVVLVRPRR